MGIAFPGESSEYRAARDRLLEQEIELRRAMESVAAARRELPPGGVVPEDYVFQGAHTAGEPTDVRLSELFAPGKDSLVIYSFMFPRDPGDRRPGPASGHTALLALEELAIAALQKNFRITNEDGLSHGFARSGDSLLIAFAAQMLIEVDSRSQ